MEENNYLVESFGNSIGSDIAELTAEAAEFTFDACSGEDSILKEVPFVGTAVNTGFVEAGVGGGACLRHLKFQKGMKNNKKNEYVH